MEHWPCGQKVKGLCFAENAICTTTTILTFRWLFDCSKPEFVCLFLACRLILVPESSLVLELGGEGWLFLSTKKPVDEGKRREWKAGLKLNIQETKMMASGPITSRQIHGGKVETVTVFIFLGSKVIADGDYSHKIKRYLLLGRKAMTKLDSMLKKERESYRFGDKRSYSQRWFF